MKHIAIIGAGISGLSVARLLRDRYVVKVFEKETVPGGLVRCERVEGNLFHICGGHIFNSKRQDVLDWFWKLFDREAEFVKADRNSVVCMDGEKMVPYPIENHFYMFDPQLQRKIIDDLLAMKNEDGEHVGSFEDFLRLRFGETLYGLYFKPYNEKVWRRPLNTVPLDWLAGKLPMPTPGEILYNNINRVEEKNFVHATFWYEKEGGSQYLANRLAEGTDISFGCPATSISRIPGKASWSVNGEEFDAVVFCGNLKELPGVISGIDVSRWESFIENLEYHGTTSVLCELAANDYSWIYQPSSAHRSHRIICTGNFSPSNNASGKLSGTVEFTDEISKEDILHDLASMPFHPRYIAHCYNKFTYPVQGADTRAEIAALKDYLSRFGLYLCGRFAEWEYFNMDAAMGAAIDLCKTL